MAGQHHGRMNTIISNALSSTTLGEPVGVEALTMFPLLGPPDVEAPPAYVTLDQAIGDAWTEVTEVSDQGSVPELRVINKGRRPVFIVDGEELVGAKQNRIVNLSILVPEQVTLTIPVSCVEAGRWRSRSRAFSAAPRTQYAAGRAKRMAQVTESMRMHGARYSDQAEVWADIAAKSERLAAHSATGAMEEIFVRHAEFADRCVAAFLPVDRQCGALFVIDGRVVGFDLFDRAATLRRLLPKLVRSVAVDAIDREMSKDGDAPALVRKADRRAAGARVSRPVQTMAAEHFLEITCAAIVHEAPAVGLGRDLRFVHPKISGAALEANGAIVHLSAFHL
jgi:hypothetical protein